MCIIFFFIIIYLGKTKTWTRKAALYFWYKENLVQIIVCHLGLNVETDRHGSSYAASQLHQFLSNCQVRTLPSPINTSPPPWAWNIIEKSSERIKI